MTQPHEDDFLYEDCINSTIFSNKVYWNHLTFRPQLQNIHDYFVHIGKGPSA